METFETSLSKFSLNASIGDFNVKSTKYCTGDTINFESFKHEAITCQFGLKKIISWQTQIQGKSASWVDVIFTSQPISVMDCAMPELVYLLRKIC